MQVLTRPFNTLFWLLQLLCPGAKPESLVDFSAFVGTTLLQGLFLALLLLPAFDLLEQGPIVLFFSYRLGVLRAKHLFSDGQGALEERFGRVVLFLVPVEVCQVVERACCLGVLGAKHLFSDGQSALEERFGLLVLAPGTVEVCQVVEQVRGVRMIDPVLFLSNG